MSRNAAKSESDLDLIRSTIRRREEGHRQFPEFRKFLEKYEPRLRYRVLRQLNFNQSLADDVLQEAKYKFFRTGLMDSYRHSPWAYYQTVVKSCMLDALYRSRKHWHDPLDQPMPDGKTVPREDKNAPRPDSVLSASRYQQAVGPVLSEAFRRLIAKSPGKLHTVQLLTKRYIDGRSVKDIAREGGYKRPNTVTKIIHRTLKDLLQILNDMRKEGFSGTDLVYETIGRG